MNKEEFYNIVQNELDKLLEEKKEIQATLDYYSIINEDGSYDNDSFYQEQRKQALYKLKLYKVKIDKVKKLLGYPIYIRIKSMTDFELEQYRTQEISILIGKIEELRKEKEKEQNKVKELKNKQRELISKLASSSESQRDEARKEAKEIFEELKKYDSKPAEDTIEKQIKELENKIEVLKKKMNEDLREELEEKLHNNGIYINVETRKTKDYSNFLTEISEEYEKVEKMIDLAIKKEELEKNTEEVNYVDDYEFDDVIHNLPKSFKEKMPGKRVVFTTDDGLIKLENYINEYQEKVKKVKEEFVSEFCSDNNEIKNDLLDLIINRRMNSDTIFDLKTFDKYLHTISPYKIVELKGWLKQKEELSRKIIKTENVKYKIKNINREISQLEFDIFNEIVEFYKEKLKKVFYIFSPSELELLDKGNIIYIDSVYNKEAISNIDELFNDPAKMTTFINQVLKLFNSIEYNINIFKEKIEEVKNKDEKRFQEKEHQISQIDEDIRKLSDIEFDTDIPYMGSTKEEIEDFIINNVANYKQDEIATKVENGLKEYLLDGLNPDYLEELRVLKESIKKLKDEEETKKEESKNPFTF